jgi:hypothetical protein
MHGPSPDLHLDDGQSVSEIDVSAGIVVGVVTALQQSTTSNPGSVNP